MSVAAFLNTFSAGGKSISCLERQRRRYRIGAFVNDEPNKDK